MAKKRTYNKRKKREKVNQIDHIPTYSHQPRSPAAPKRRTDFSLFFSQGLSLPLIPIDSLSYDIIIPYSLLESSSSKEISSSISIASLDDTKDKSREVVGLPLVRCSETQDKRYNDKKKSDTDRTLQFTPGKLQMTKSNDVCKTPRSVTGAKNTGQLWWPAEYLRQKELLGACKMLTGPPDESNCSNPREQSPENCNSQSSSINENDYMGKGRSKRERKPKVHFDEVSPVKSERKVRRFRIMQFLGLAAPIGSPFSVTSYKRTASK